MGLLEIDEVQAGAILDMQLRRLAALERQKIIDEYDELMRDIADYNAILASRGAAARRSSARSWPRSSSKYGDERRTRIVAAEGDMSIEDLIAEEDVVVTITRGGYAKRTQRRPLPLAAARRQGRARGAAAPGRHRRALLRHHDPPLDPVLHQQGPGLPGQGLRAARGGRDARGQHVANLLAFQPDETIAQVLDLRDYDVAPYLVLATRRGLVKKTRLAEYDSPRAGGLIAINLREDDELVSARLVARTTTCCWSRARRSRCASPPTTTRCGRWAARRAGSPACGSGTDDELLAMEVVRPGASVFTVTDGGFAKRTSVDEWTAKGRGGLGVQAATDVL